MNSHKIWLAAVLLLACSLSVQAQTSALEVAARTATEVSLRDYLEAQIRWVDRYFEEKIRLMNLAVDKAEVSIKTRLEGMNEFREALKDQAGRLATKEELLRFDDRVKALESKSATRMETEMNGERIKVLEINAAQSQGKANVMSALWAIGVSLVVGIILRIWKAPVTTKREVA